MNPESKSAQSITRGPLAGSLSATLVLPNRRRIPSSTMKCWNAQKMMAGFADLGEPLKLGLVALGNKPIAAGRRDDARCPLHRPAIPRRPPAVPQAALASRSQSLSSFPGRIA